MDSIAEAVGLPPDQLALIGGLLLSILLSFIMKDLKSPNAKIWMNIIFGTMMQWALYKGDIIYNWIQTIIIYFICAYAPRKKLGKYVMIQSGLFLLGIQFKRYLSSVTTNVDITAILMISTTKFIRFAYCYQDGAFETHQLNYPKQQGPRVISKLPNIFTYLGYIQFIPTAMIGPTFQYSDYINYIHRTGEFEHIPNTVKAALAEFRTSIFFIAVYLVLDSVFNVEYLISSEYSQLNFLMQFMYVLVVILTLKFKYYTAWSICAIGVKGSGIGYQKYVNNKGLEVEDFERIQYANPIPAEFEPSLKVKIDNWNINVQVFLKRYLYQRILSQKDQQSAKGAKLKKRAQQLTLLYSTFWHGFYPGYLLSFFHWMLILQVTQQIYRIGKSHPKLLNFYNNNKIVQYLTILIADYIFCWVGVFFHLYYLDKIWVFAAMNNYIQLIILYLCFIFIVKLKIFSGGKGERKQKGQAPALAKTTPEQTITQ